MSLSSGSKLSSYEILGPLGAGAMGEVYRARDTRLGREVAIKVLPESFADDEERLKRFEREARALAALNHPNVAQIYGVDQVGDTCLLVLELVAGETLEERLKRGPLALEETLDVCRQIADGLEAAHHAGLIHRDLKPANVRITLEGKVKVLDFGLAKAMSPDGDERSSKDSVLSTEQGRLLGTPTYMAPEQARGKAIDGRVDVWAFGCVLYECLTAKRAFAGETLSDVLGAVLHTTPDLARLPAQTPAPVRTLLERCLAKDRAQRLSSFAVVRFLLNEPSASGASAAARPRASRLPLFALGAVSVALAAACVALLLRRDAISPASAMLTRASVILPAGLEVAKTFIQPLALSPDGSRLVWVGNRAGTEQLFLRALSEDEARPLDGTENALSPFFSPDGEWIAFFAQGKIKKIAANGAGVQVVCDGTPDPRGGTWTEDGTIYFAPNNSTGLMQVPASGGTPKPLTTLDRDRGEVSHRWPKALPESGEFLFCVWTGPGTDEIQIVAQSLSSGARRVLVSGGGSPGYVDGQLLYTREDHLFALSWRPGQASVGSAAPVALSEHPRDENEGAAVYAVSSTGTLAFLPGGVERYRLRVVWVDRAGNVEPSPLPLRNYESVALSPDGRRACVQIHEGTTSLWLYDFERDTLTPLATPGGSSQAPVWTPDGARIVYRATRNGRRSVYWKAADGTGEEQRLTAGEEGVATPHSISPDGKWLFYSQIGTQGGGGDILALRLNADGAAPLEESERAPRALVATAAPEGCPHISPDGRWLAYWSDLSGKREVYVQPFPGPGPSHQVSTDTGEEPLWSRDGRELFYRRGDALMVVDVTTEPSFTASRPRVLFEGRFREHVNGNTPYSASLDGQRFLRVWEPAGNELDRIELVLGWSGQLRAGSTEE